MKAPAEIASAEIESFPALKGHRESLMRFDALWHAGWAAAVVASMALLLLATGAISVQILLTTALMASPGILGTLWRSKAPTQFALLAFWTLCAVLAVCITGGLSGPLAVLCITPILAGLVIGASWQTGVGLSVGAVLLCAIATGLHFALPPPAEPTRTALTLIALLGVAIAAGAALLATRRKVEAERQDASEELSAFQTLMGDLPEFALALHADGRTEGLFGRPLEGVDMTAFHAGLIHVAASEDQPRLQFAMDEALATGASQASFSIAENFAARSSDRQIAAAFRRTRVGGVVAILRRPMPPAAAVAAVVALPSAEIMQRLDAAEAGRRDAEIGREKAEANATARARFLANMSHELRTPLNAIMGFSDMMRAKMFGELTPKYAEYADLIHESGGHLLDLINDVLDMSKIEAQRYTLSREVFDVRDALGAALRLMRLQADDAGVKLRSVLPGEALMVDADKRAIKQIVLNLLSNALKFTPKDGTVILSAGAVGHDLELVVADTGMGIAADDLKRLGQPFEQAGGAGDRARGAGLGLSLVEAFANLHGGAMTLESRLGEGTAVTVRMPVLAAAPAAPEPVVSKPVAPEPVAFDKPTSKARKPRRPKAD